MRESRLQPCRGMAILNATTADADMDAFILLSHNAMDHAASITGGKVLWRVLVDPGDDRVARLAVAHDTPRDVNAPGDYEALQNGASSISGTSIEGMRQPAE